MEELKDALGLIDMNPRPTFCVRDGIIVKTNPAAAGHMIENGTPVLDLLSTGAEEYEAFTGGCLYLTMTAAGQKLGVSVVKLQEYDIFRIEQDADNSELQAMALAARELREPLSSVMITADRLFPVSGLYEDPATREQVARINRGLFQMLRVIGNMSDAGRYVSDSSTRQEVRDICSFFVELFTRAGDLVAHTGLTLEYTGYPEPIYTLVDAEKLERAIFNIISNAIKFTPKGGTIQAKLTRRGKKLYLTIQDSGSGIPENLRGTVYSRYTREPDVEDGRFGIGLGMVLIRSAAAIHGGTVLIDHPDGTGTRITMSLAIRPDSGTPLRSPILRVDYAGERDHGLIELSDTLPATLYDPKKVN